MIRICSWSGPRNVSTALMRSFEARGDCEVVDEPLYAAYLHATGKDHPGREEVLASQPRDPAAALAALTVPGPLPIRFEKHMAHHWLLGWPWEALGAARHLLLIRDPARVVASYAKVREDPLPEDLGLQQQLELRDRVGVAAIVDGDELLADPSATLSALCAALGLGYTPAMLSWPPGRRRTDGVWAPHWYAAVEASTGFGPPPSSPPEVPERLRGLVDELRPLYEALAADRLRT